MVKNPQPSTISVIFKFFSIDVSRQFFENVLVDERKVCLEKIQKKTKKKFSAG